MCMHNQESFIFIFNIILLHNITYSVIVIYYITFEKGAAVSNKTDRVPVGHINNRRNLAAHLWPF